LLLKFFKLFGKGKPEIDPEMKYLIVGLGNMHPDYDGTRHNIGFEVVDFIAQEKAVQFKNDSHGDLAVVKHRGRQIHLLKPSTYMNLSGKAVRYWMQKLKLPLDKVLIVVDDINIDFGKLRLRGKGAHGGHNGLKDIERMLGTNKYARLRFGIGSDFSKGRQVDYVLGKWSSEEMDQLSEYIPKAADASLSYCSIGLNNTMNKFNN
jgi:PTH1 family peptidyl-tRNA hydrolase